MKRLEPGDSDYAACYCEENVWRLLAREELAGWETQAADGSWTLAAIRSPGEVGPGLLLDAEGLAAFLT